MSKVNRILVEFKITKINQNSNISSIKSFKAFLPTATSQGVTLSDSPHSLSDSLRSVLTDDMRNYVSLALNHSSVCKKFNNLDVSLKHLEASAGLYISTSDFEFKIIKITKVNDHQHFVELVKEVSDYEDNIFKLTVAIIDSMSESIIYNAKKRKEYEAKNKSLASLHAAKNSWVIATISFDAPYVQKPITFDFLVDQSISDTLDAQKAKELQLAYFENFYKDKIKFWTHCATSASSNHPARIAYAQQALDIEKLYLELFENKSTCKLINTVVLTRLEREISNDEFIALVKSINKILARNNTYKCTQLFSDWQTHLGTINPAGVLN